MAQCTCPAPCTTASHLLPACAALWRAALCSPAGPLLLAYLHDVDFAPLGLLPPHPPLLPSPLPHLTPLRPLGSGLFGRVFLTAPPASLAVKQVDLRALYAAPGPLGMGQAHRALRELRALRLVSASQAQGSSGSSSGSGGTRFIVGLRGHCASPCRRWLYLLLEHCPGPDLLQRLRQRGAGGLPLVEARGHLACLLAALRALHRLGLAHRDVRPSNLAVGSDGLLRLLDFNLCRGGSGLPGGAGAGAAAAAAAAAGGGEAAPPEALQRAAAQWRPGAAAPSGAPPPPLPMRFHSAAQAAAFAAWCALQSSSSAPLPAARPLRRAFSVVGSLVHLAPEAAARDMSLLEHALAADVWSLGVTAYQLLTGQCPGTLQPAWLGEEGSEEAASAAGAGAGAAHCSAMPLPPALLQQCPHLESFLAAACTMQASARPTVEQLCAHPLFSQPLALAPPAQGGYWHGAVQWEELLGGGSLPPLVTQAAEEGAAAVMPAPAWGAGTFFFGRAERQGAEEEAEAGQGGVEEADDVLQAAAEYSH